MDWDLAIKRNSEALKGIVEVLFAMLGLAGAHGFADSAAPPPRRAACAPARRIRRAAPCRHRGARPCGEACSFASDAGGANMGRGGGCRLPSFQLFDPRKSFADLRQRERPRGLPRASISSEAIPGWQPCGQRPGPPPIPLRRPMASSTPNASAAGSRPSSWRSRICRARPGVSPAGG